MSEPNTTPFQPANELERLLAEAATDPATRPAFYRAITEAELLVIREGPPPPEERSFVAESDVTFGISAVELEGKPHLPLFTSAQRIAEVVPREVGYVAMNGRALLTMLRGNDLVLNPGAAYGKLFSKEEVESILDGSVFAPQARPDVGGKRILIGQPANYPSHVTEPLARLFRGMREVRTAWVAHVSIDGGPPHTLIALEVSGDWERLVEEAGLVVREVIEPGEIVDFARVTDARDEPIGSYVRQHTKPFYRRRVLGMF
jgi:hypothetical protein